MSNLTNNTTELQAIINILVDKINGIQLPTLTNEATPADLMVGKELIDSLGNKIVGTFSLEEEIEAQNVLIAELKAALADKGAGGNAIKELFELVINRDVTVVNVPEGVTKIGNYAFCDCRKLVEINLPETVTTIAYRSFYSCQALESITLPASLRTMNAGQTFTSSTKLTTVRLLGATPPTIATNTFPDTITTFIVPKGAKSTYDAASNWSALMSKIVEES